MQQTQQTQQVEKKLLRMREISRKQARQVKATVKGNKYYCHNCKRSICYDNAAWLGACDECYMERNSNS